MLVDCQAIRHPLVSDLEAVWITIFCDNRYIFPIEKKLTPVCVCKYIEKTSKIVSKCHCLSTPKFFQIQGQWISKRKIILKALRATSCIIFFRLLIVINSVSVKKITATRFCYFGSIFIVLRFQMKVNSLFPCAVFVE